MIALARAKVAFTVHEYASVGDGATYGEAVAASLNLPAAQLFKTLIAEVDGTAVMAIVPTDSRLDMKVLASSIGGKRAVMADPADAERWTGYVTGGISPFGQRRRLRAVVDASIEALGTVFVSGGRRGLQIELVPADLLRQTAGETVEGLAR